LAFFLPLPPSCVFGTWVKRWLTFFFDVHAAKVSFSPVCAAGAPYSRRRVFAVGLFFPWAFSVFSWFLTTFFSLFSLPRRPSI